MDRGRVSLWSIWIVVMVVVGYLALNRFGGWVDGSLHELSLRREGQNLSFSSSSDGPFLVFGIAAYGRDAGDKRWSPIEPPLVIMDSAGASFDIKSLHWRNYHGEPASAPIDQRLYPLYVRPERFDAYPKKD